MGNDALPASLRKTGGGGHTHGEKNRGKYVGRDDPGALRNRCRARHP